MPKSKLAIVVDGIQRALRPAMKAHGFRVRGRTFNRVTKDGLTQAVNFQMGRFDPPGTSVIPGFRDNAYGKFTVNLGVFVPEVAECGWAGRSKSWVQESNCCVQVRLGEVCGSEVDLWWPASEDPAAVDEVHLRLETSGLPFLDRHETRDLLLKELEQKQAYTGSGGPPRVTRAIIHAGRNEMDEARRLLREQALGREGLEGNEALRAGHREHIQKLATKLGLQNLGL